MDSWQHCIVQLPESHHQISCQWRVKAVDLGLEPTLASPFNALDILFTTKDKARVTTEPGIEILQKASQNGDENPDTIRVNPIAFILSNLESRANSPAGFSNLAIKLLLPAEKGYIVRSTILRQRVAGCQHVQSALDFLEPFEEIMPTSLAQIIPKDFQRLINSASGGIVLQSSTEISPIQALDYVDSQLSIRLSIPWILPSPPSAQVIVAIGSHRIQSMETFYYAAQSLGIRILLVASKDDESYSHCRDEIITVDMTLDEGLQSRILDALKKHPGTINGIVAYRDTLLVTAAKVAEKLGLPAPPPSAVSACVNKYEMRKIDMTNCSQLLFARNLQDLKEKIASSPDPLEFSLVVKPSEGQGSVGVSKVTDMQQLYDAVTAIENHNSSMKPGIIVESYIDGPEIDANFVLLEGEILFFEVVDNFPCTADEEGHRKTDSFLEQDMVYPSGLSPSEILVVKNRIHRLLVDNLGFRNGVFHVEARVCGSNMHYIEENGIIDLRPVREIQTKTPSIFILEVNARCPGVAGVFPTAYTYGVDLAALWLLSAIGDSRRLRALSQPFRNGPQLWCDLVPVTVTRGGVLDSDDIMEDLRERRPDLMNHVPSTTIFYRRGDVVPEPSVTNLAGIIAEFVCCSRKSREDLLEVVQKIREEVRVPWK